MASSYYIVVIEEEKRVRIFLMSKFEHVISDLWWPIDVFEKVIVNHLVVDIPVFQSAKGSM